MENKVSRFPDMGAIRNTLPPLNPSGPEYLRLIRAAAGDYAVHLRVGVLRSSKHLKVVQMTQPGRRQKPFNDNRLPPVDGRQPEIFMAEQSRRHIQKTAFTDGLIQAVSHFFGKPFIVTLPPGSLSLSAVRISSGRKKSSMCTTHPPKSEASSSARVLFRRLPSRLSL